MPTPTTSLLLAQASQTKRPSSFASAISPSAKYTAAPHQDRGTTTQTMSVTRTTHVAGTGPQPRPGQKVTIAFTGWLKDTSQPGNKGVEFDRGDVTAEIGMGRLIRGWEVAVLDMRTGEHATLDITSDYGYGAIGFRGHIPPHADLIFDVHLKSIQ